MRFILLLISILSFQSSIYAQNKIVEIKAFQSELNEEFSNKSTSPLDKKDRRKFKGLAFFDIDTAYYITAEFTRTPNQKPFKMATSTDRKPVYEKYGEVRFSLDSIEVKLDIFQSHDLRRTEEYKNHLFLPFTDYSNGEETYGGGRYLDLSIPEGKTIIIDFNKAYNPYCAYSSRFSCPLVPRQNRVKTKVKAGVKAFKSKSNH